MVASLVVLPLGTQWQNSPYWIALIAILASAVISFTGLNYVLGNGEIRYSLGGWVPPLGIEYVLDNISAFVTVVITSISVLVIFATRHIVSTEINTSLGSFYCLVLLLLAGLTGIVVTGDLFNLFVFLEIASLAAYSLVFLGGRRAMLAGYRYLILGSIGGSLYLLGVAFIYFSTGSLNMSDVFSILNDQGPSTPVSAGAIFIFAGLGLKMGLVPLHFWLPNAYAESPSTVASLIAPIMTKVAAYAMLRMFISVFPTGYLVDEVPIGLMLISLGLVGVLVGSFVAMSQTNLRRMLAYSSISQLGLIAVAIGLATPLSFVAALLHIMNHAIMKAVLFLVVTDIKSKFKSEDLSSFLGMGKVMRINMFAFTIAAVSMIGIPPTAGFFSKWYLALAAVEQGQWFVVVVIFGSSLLTAVYIFKLLEKAFLRPLDLETQDGGIPTDSSATQCNKLSSLHVTPVVIILALSVIAIGIFNMVIITHILEPAL